MAQALPLSTHDQKWGETTRTDDWRTGPILVVIGLAAFLIYGTWAAWQSSYFEVRQDRRNFHAPGNPAVAPYLSPFYAPLVYDPQSHHAWYRGDLKPTWLPGWF